MRRKLIIILVIFIMMVPNVALAGKASYKVVNNKASAVKYINKFIEASSKLKEIEASMGTVVSIKMPGGPTQKITGKAKLRVKKAQEHIQSVNDFVLSMFYNVNFYGKKSKGSTFIKDGILYYNTKDGKKNEKLKMPIEIGEFNQKPIKVQLSWIKSAKIMKYKNGKVVVSAVVNPVNIVNFATGNPTLNPMMQKKKIDQKTIEKISKIIKLCKIQYVAVNNRIKMSSVSIVAKQKNTTIKGKVRVDFNKLENIGPIKFPEDLESYKAAFEE